MHSSTYPIPNYFEEIEASLNDGLKAVDEELKSINVNKV